jgi:hypothetical protein
LAITLSIRNIDLDADITISEVKYYGSKGKLIKSFVKDALSIKPQGPCASSSLKTKKAADPVPTSS